MSRREMKWAGEGGGEIVAARVEFIALFFSNAREECISLKTRRFKGDLKLYGIRILRIIIALFFVEKRSASGPRDLWRRVGGERTGTLCFYFDW